MSSQVNAVCWELVGSCSDVDVELVFGSNPKCWRNVGHGVESEIVSAARLKRQDRATSAVGPSSSGVKGAVQNRADVVGRH